MKIRFNDTTFNVTIIRRAGEETLLRYEETGEEEWTPDVDLERYVKAQEEYEHEGR